jgi:hypothetical protein
LRLRRAAEEGVVVAPVESTQAMRETVPERLIGEGAHA